MTTPTGTSSQQDLRAELAAIAAIAALLEVNQSAQALTPRVQRLVRGLGLASSAVTGAVTLAMRRPIPQVQRPSGIALGLSREAERTYRAAYIVQSAKRIHQAVREGSTVEQATAKERGLYKRHLEAAAKRSVAASRVDSAAKRYGDSLGWYAKNDARTTLECKWANGRNFKASQRPPMGYPGTVHVHCRCRPGPPYRQPKGTVYDKRKAA